MVSCPSALCTAPLQHRHVPISSWPRGSMQERKELGAEQQWEKFRNLHHNMDLCPPEPGRTATFWDFDKPSDSRALPAHSILNSSALQNLSHASYGAMVYFTPNSSSGPAIHPKYAKHKVMIKSKKEKKNPSPYSSASPKIHLTFLPGAVCHISAAQTWVRHGNLQVTFPPLAAFLPHQPREEKSLLPREAGAAGTSRSNSHSILWQIIRHSPFPSHGGSPDLPC